MSIGPRTALGALTLVVGIALTLAPRPATDNSVEAITATGDARAAVYQAFRRSFGADEVIVIRLEAGSLPALAEAIDRAEETLERFDAIDRLMSPGAAYPDALAIIEDPDLFDETTRRRIAARLSGPLGRSLGLMSLEPPTATIYALSELAPPDAWRAVQQALLRLRGDLRAEGIRMIFGGSPLLNLALDREGARVERQALPILVGVSIAALAFVLRSARLVVCLLVPVGLGVLGAEGAFGLFGETGNLVVNIAKPLLFVILLASGLHVVVAFEHRLGRGEPRREAAWGAARDKARGVALALLTTAVGFSSLTFAEVAPIRSFGALAAFGLAGGGPLVLFGLPFLLAWLGPAMPARSASRFGRRLEALLARTVRWASERPRSILIPAATVTLAGALLLPSLRSSTHPIRFFDETHPVRVAHEGLEAAGAGLASLEAVLSPNRPEPLGALDAWAATATAIPGVLGRLDLPLLLREAQFRASGADVVPGPATAALLLERRPELSRSLKKGELYRVSLLLGTATAEELDRIEERLERARTRLLPEAELVLTGNYDLLVRAQGSLLNTLLASLGATLVLMELVLLLAVRSLRLALVALLPNVLPVAGNVLLMWALDLPLDVGTAMTGAVALGIAVDDTLHFLVAWKDEGQDAAIRRTGRALVLSTAVIALGFFSLLGSEFLPTFNFALLTGTAMITALVGDLLILPPLLRWCAPAPSIFYG